MQRGNFVRGARIENVAAGAVYLKGPKRRKTRKTMASDEPTMTAVRFHDYGDASVLAVESVPRPTPQLEHVLVRVRAAAVNPLDWKLRQGLMKDMMPLQLPFTPGGDLAGVVEAVEGGAKFAVGDAVFGALAPFGGGAYAEFAVAAPDVLEHKPENLSFAEAASVPGVALTAWQALFDFGGLQSGQTLLIHGGAGGVGLFAVQFAKQKGATVYATCSDTDKAFVSGLGADTVIDYKNERFEDVVQNVDVVLDLVGGETRDRSWGVLKPGGILVSTPAPPSPEKAAAHNVRAAFVQLKPTAGLLAQIAQMLGSGAVKTEVGKTFPLSDAAAAQELSQHGHVRGKIVLTVD